MPSPSSAAHLRALVPSDSPAAEPAAAWFTRYLRFKETACTACDIAARVRRYVLPFLGARSMGEITPNVLRGLVRALDDRVREAAGTDTRFSAKTAWNVWGDVRAAMSEAVSSKRDSLRVLAANPCALVRGPDRTEARSKPFLYPDELVMLLSSGAVPARRRRFYAVAAYAGARSSELAALLPEDVDFTHLRLHVGKQVDRDTALTRVTKTRRVRDVDVEPALVAVLALLVAHPEGKGGRLLHAPPIEDRAELLRRDLARAGCWRPALTADDAIHAPIVFHSLRDTCLSHMAVRGDASHLIQWRAGHTTIAMTQKYIEAARRYARGFGDPFPPIPAELASTSTLHRL
jgi:integrase